MARSSVLSKQAICLVCGDSLHDAVAVDCRACATPHHRDCFQYVGSCAVFGCGSDVYRHRLSSGQGAFPDLVERMATGQRRRPKRSLKRPADRSRQGRPSTESPVAHPEGYVVFVDYYSHLEQFVRFLAAAAILIVIWGAILGGITSIPLPYPLAVLFLTAVLVLPCLAAANLEDVLAFDGEAQGIFIHRRFFGKSWRVPFYQVSELEGICLVSRKVRSLGLGGAESHEQFWPALYVRGGGRFDLGEPAGTASYDARRDTERLVARMAAAIDVPLLDEVKRIGTFSLGASADEPDQEAARANRLGEGRAKRKSRAKNRGNAKQKSRARSTRKGRDAGRTPVEAAHLGRTFGQQVDNAVEFSYTLLQWGMGIGLVISFSVGISKVRPSEVPQFFLLGLVTGVYFYFSMQRK